MRTNTGPFTQVVADAAEHTRQRVVLAHYLQRLGGVAVSHRAHVPRDFLIYRTFIDARGLNAVEQPEFAWRLGVCGVERVLDVLRVAECSFCVVVQVEVSGSVNVCMRLVCLRGFENELINARRPRILERIFYDLEILQQAQVASGL